METEEKKERESPSLESPPRKLRGFAAMDPKRVAEIAAQGGRAAHRKGTGHQFTPEEAREAGRKGGYATHAKYTKKPTEVTTTVETHAVAGPCLCGVTHKAEGE